MYPNIYTEPEQGVAAGASEGGYTMSLKDLLQVLKRRVWIIALVAVALTMVAVGLSLMMTPIYTANAEILVGQGQQKSSGNAAGNLAGDVQGLQGVAQTVAVAVPSRTVAEIVIKNLNLKTTPEAFLQNLSVQQVSTTQLVEISYTAPNPTLARNVANEVASVSSEQISKLSPGSSPITANTWESAATPFTPVSPNPLRNGALALVLGLMLGIGLAFLLEYLGDSWRSPEEVEQVSGVPTFGIIPEFKIPKSKKKGAN